MRLLVSSPQFQTLLAIPFLVAMLALPASAEPNSKAGPSSAPSTAKTESGAETTPSAAPRTESTAETKPPANAKPEKARLGAATSEDDSAAPGKNAATDDAKPEKAEVSADAAAVEAPKSTVLVDIDKSTQEMTVFIDGIEQYRWPVSTGARGYSTPSGTYTASSMNEIWYSRQWDNAPMPHAIFFTKKGHAIHGTMEEKNLGNAASHGCVRLSRANAKTLFQLVKETGLENTQVVLTGVTKGGEGPKVATTGSRRQEAYPPWFEPGYYPPGQRKKRRGLFGRRWFQPDTQGYYQAPRYRRY